MVVALLSMCRLRRGGVQQEDLGGGSGAAIVSLGTLVFGKTATFKDTVDVSCDSTHEQCQTNPYFLARTFESTPTAVNVMKSLWHCLSYHRFYLRCRRFISSLVFLFPLPRTETITPPAYWTHRQWSHRYIQGGNCSDGTMNDNEFRPGTSTTIIKRS